MKSVSKHIFTIPKTVFLINEQDGPGIGSLQEAVQGIIYGPKIFLKDINPFFHLYIINIIFENVY
jgi:hypothetical protein